MNRAYKFRIYPNSEQRIMFAKTFGCVRFVFEPSPACRGGGFMRSLADKQPLFSKASPSRPYTVASEEPSAYL